MSNRDKKVVITYGTFDLLHFGHIALLERAKKLGDFLIVGITSDTFDKSRGKFNVKQPLVERIEAVKATEIVDKIIIEEFQGQKIEDIKRYHVDTFAIGSDWEGRFDYLNEYCGVVYLERTEGISSTELRAHQTSELKMGYIGFDYLTERMIRESRFIGDLRFTEGYSFPNVFEGAGNTSTEILDSITRDSPDEVMQGVDAIYLNVPMQKRTAQIEKAIRHNCHVLCEGPISDSVYKAKILLQYANSKNLVLQESLYTAYLPGFLRLKLLLESGIVGEIIDIDASFTHVFDKLDKQDIYQGSHYNMSTRAVLPALAFLGTDFKSSNLTCSFEGDFCTWSKLDLLYPSSSATIKIGRGIKTEGAMIITGTAGYVYVPAPWWKLEYFEIRYEDLRDTKKLFFEFAGEGQRYLLKNFSQQIRIWPETTHDAISKETTLASIGLIEKFAQADYVKLSPHSYRFGGGEQIPS